LNGPNLSEAFALPTSLLDKFINLSSLNDQEGHVGKVMSIPGVLWKMVITLQIQLPWGSNIGGDAPLVDDKQNCVNDKVD